MAYSVTVVAGLAAGKIFPWAAFPSIVGPIDTAPCQKIVLTTDGKNAAMAIDTIHATGLHGSPLALGDLTRVALVAGCYSRRKDRLPCVLQFPVVSVHDIREQRLSNLIASGACAAQIQRRGIMASGA